MGVVLCAPNGDSTSLIYKLSFSCSNNEAEYEALIIGLTSTIKVGIRRPRIQWDSKITIKQVNDEFALKKVSLVPYRTAIQKLVKGFDDVQFQHCRELAC